MHKHQPRKKGYGHLVKVRIMDIFLDQKRFSVCERSYECERESVCERERDVCIYERETKKDRVCACAKVREHT